MEIRRLATLREREEVLNLLFQAFPDTPEDYFPRRTFFDINYRLEDTFVLVKSGKIVSTLHVFYGEIWVQGEKVPFAGIGNVATLPEMQGQGFGSRLMEGVVKFLEEDTPIQVSILFTGTPKFYEKFGYHLYQIREFMVSSDGEYKDSVITFSPHLSRSIVEIRNAYNSRFIGPVVKDLSRFQHEFSYVKEDRSLFLVNMAKDGPSGYIRCLPEGDTIQIIDFASTRPEEDFPVLINAVSSRSGMNKFKISLPTSELFSLNSVAGGRNIMFKIHKKTVSSEMILENFEEYGNFWLIDTF